MQDEKGKLRRYTTSVARTLGLAVRRAGNGVNASRRCFHSQGAWGKKEALKPIS